MTCLSDLIKVAYKYRLSFQILDFEMFDKTSGVYFQMYSVYI